MNKFYFVNYNRLIEKDTKYLLSVFFDSNHPLKKIAWDVILCDSRLLDNSIDNEILGEIIGQIEIEHIWHLANCSKEYYISQIAYKKVMDVIDDYECLENRRLIKLLNGKMPS